MLLKTTVQTKYENVVIVSSGSKLTQIETILASKRCFRVSPLCLLSFLGLHFYEF